MKEQQKVCLTIIVAIGFLGGISRRIMAQEEAADQVSTVPTHPLEIRIEKPKGAFVFVDGRLLISPLGNPYQTPVTVPDVPQGIHNITLAKKGYQDRTVRHRVDEEAEPITGTLARGRSRLLRRPFQFDTTLAQIAPPAEPGHGEDDLIGELRHMGKAIDQGRITDTAVVGPEGGEPFAYMPHEGALLVGFNVSERIDKAPKIVLAIQPVFLTPRGQVVGPWYGDPNQKYVRTVRARPGYAVAGLAVREGLKTDGIGVTFARVNGNRVNLADSYNVWMGGQGGKKPQRVGFTGAPALGLLGRSGQHIYGVGLMIAR